MSLALRLLFFTLFSAFTGIVLRADTLILANGDRLKGTLVRNVDDLITFKSDILGEIVVATTKATVEIDLTPEQKIALEKAAEEKKVADAAKAVASKPKDPNFKEVDLRTAERTPNRKTKVDEVAWVNQIELGFINQSGRADKIDVTARSENTRKTPKSEARFINRYCYGQTDGIRSNDSYFSELRYRYNFARRYFFQSNTRYNRDAMKYINCDIEQGAGVGANLLTQKLLVLNAGTDVAERYRNYMATMPTQPADPNMYATIVDVFQDMSINFSQRFSLKQEFVAVIVPSKTDEYKINFNAALSGKVTNTLSIQTRFDLEYDKSLVPDSRYNQRITTTLGYTF